MLDIDGQLYVELICHGGGGEKLDMTLEFCDGTVLEVRSNRRGVWTLVARDRGELLDRVSFCDDLEITAFSDVAYFRDGLEWWYVTGGEDWAAVAR